MTKNDVHIFNKFIKEYKTAIQKFEVGEFMNKNQLLNILHYLGYVDQFVNEQSMQTAITISYMLSHKNNNAISQQNLFKFLMIISNIKGDSSKYFQKEAMGMQMDQIFGDQQILIQINIGSFTQTGEWIYTVQQNKQVKQLFGSLNLKRISRDQIQVLSRKSITIKKDTFKPSILKNSQILAERRYSKLKISKKQKVQDRLMINKSLNQSRLDSQIYKSKQKQMKQCYFEPKINKSRVLSSSLCKYMNMNCSTQNKQNVYSTANNSINKSFNSKGHKEKSGQLIGEKLNIQGKVYCENLSRLKDQYTKLNQDLQLKQCTFQPKICKKVFLRGSQTSQISNVKNTQKQIQRMKEARKKRQFQNSVKQRGYPAKISWTEYIQNNKPNNQNNLFSSSSTATFPILCIDLNIMNQNNNVNVYEGELIHDITQKICVQNNLPNQSWRRVQKLIFQAVKNCEQVKIINGMIVANNSKP